MLAKASPLPVFYPNLSWRPLRSLREILSFLNFSSSEKFKYVWLGLTSISGFVRESEGVMGKLTALLLSAVLLSWAGAQALTVDEIIELKQAGVGDATIQLLIESEGTSRAAGVWRTKDGWIVHTTETRERKVSEYGHADTYPLVVFPRVFVGRR